MEMGEEKLDKRNHYLLEINLKDLETSTGKERHYWLLHIEAARCELLLQRQNNITNSRNNREREMA